MLSAQSNYHLANKDNATVEFVSNMLQNEANNYLSNMNTLSHVSKMCSTLVISLVSLLLKVGDPLQLPATVLSTKAVSFGYSASASLSWTYLDFHVSLFLENLSVTTRVCSNDFRPVDIRCTC